MKKILSAILLSLVLIVGGVYLNARLNPPPQKALGAVEDQQLYGSATNLRTTIASTTPALLLAGNSGRTYLNICNEGTQTVWIGFIASSTVSATAATQTYFASSTGQAIFTASCKDFYPGKNMFTANLWGVAATSTSQIISLMYYNGNPGY